LFRSPNLRSALFWAPLERYSEAMRNLPEGHKIIPWITAFVLWKENGRVYEAPEPSKFDCRCLLWHLRLRGCDAYASWGIDVTPYASPSFSSHEDYRNHMAWAWRQLDDFMAGSNVKSILNLETDKVSGVEWSGIRNVNDIKILINNHTYTAKNVTESMKRYEKIFTVKDDSRIKYIRLIFYNVNGSTDMNDTIYVDNVGLKFAE
jgi:hypothetical protein